MPFSLTNGSVIYQHFINNVLFKYLNRFAIVYIDDILIYSKNVEEYTEHIYKLLQHLQNNRLQADFEKYDFKVTNIKYLGLIITIKGIQMNPEKILTIVNWPKSTNLKYI